MIIACLRANYHIYFWAKEALFSILAAVKSTCNMFLSLASVAIITRCELWRARVRLSQLLSSFIMFSAFSSPSSSRAFPTLSSCVRSWAACVRWWRVTFSGSQVGVLQALKSHNDFLHKMTERGWEKKSSSITPTHTSVRSGPLKGNVLCDPVSSECFSALSPQTVEMCCCRSSPTSWADSWTTTRANPTTRPACSCSAPCWTTWTARMWWGVEFTQIIN